MPPLLRSDCVLPTDYGQELGGLRQPEAERFERPPAWRATAQHHGKCEKASEACGTIMRATVHIPAVST